jgi:hypothetical protein
MQLEVYQKTKPVSLTLVSGFSHAATLPCPLLPIAAEPTLFLLLRSPIANLSQKRSTWHSLPSARPLSARTVFCVCIGIWSARSATDTTDADADVRYWFKRTSSVAWVGRSAARRKLFIRTRIEVGKGWGRKSWSWQLSNIVPEPVKKPTYSYLLGGFHSVQGVPQVPLHFC